MEITYDALYDEIQETVFYDHVRQRVDASVGMNLFGVKKDLRKTIVARNAHTPTGFGKATKGGDYSNMTNEEGDTLSVTQLHYAGNVTVTKDARLFVMRNEKGEADITDILDLAKGATDEAMDLVDQSYADVLLGGFADTYTDVFGDTTSSLTPDGVRLFSASHTLPGSVTFSNLINDGTNNNAALSRAAIVKAIATARKFQGAGGINRGFELDTLIVGPDQADLAERIINSDKIQGSDNNDTNMHLKRLNIVVWSRLASMGDGTDTSNYWFMANASKLKEVGIKVHSAQFLQMGKGKEPSHNENWVYPLDCYYAIARNEPQFVFGSNGTNS